MITQTELDLTYFAEQLRFLRRFFQLTQQDVALATGLTTRTIEKLESGRSAPAEQTLRSLCRGLRIERSYFIKPTPEQAQRQREATLKALRTTAVVRTTVLRDARGLMSALEGFHAWNIDLDAVGDDALEVATTFAQNLRDWGEIWDEIGLPERLDACRGLAEACAELAELGYLVHMGRYRALKRFSEGPPLQFRIGLFSIRPAADSEHQEVAMVQLEDGWQLPAEDVPKFDL
ncbi:helix-turn-helix domain-containing protein [Phenylobacterium sp.]|uniref:helix-turn-helix domain-containing protein n=1 Tax=Phenylobacterium sp. TaxID=1871053 RepID=UPI003BA8EB4B